PAPPVAVSLTPAVAPSTTLPDSRAQSTSSSDHASPLDGFQKFLLDFGQSFKAEFSTLSSRMTLLKNKVSSHQPAPAKSVSKTAQEPTSVQQPPTKETEDTPSLKDLRDKVYTLMRDEAHIPFASPSKPKKPSSTFEASCAEHFLAATEYLLNSEDTDVRAEVRSFLLELDKALGLSQLLLMGSIANCTLSKRAEFLENLSVAESLKDSLLKSPLTDKMFGSNSAKTLLQSNSDKFVSYSRPSQVSTSISRSGQNVTKICNRGVSLLTLSPGFYSRLFLVSKKTGEMRPAIDLSILKLSYYSPFQNGNQRVNQSFNPSRNVEYFSGSFRCLFQHSYFPYLKEIPSLRLEQQSFPVQGSPFWPVYSPIGFYQNHAGSYSSPTFPVYTDSFLPGRFPSQEFCPIKLRV
ncbi:Hypothetical predicted protein, partial [Mytilus galloprovincialis]